MNGNIISPHVIEGTRKKEIGKIKCCKFLVQFAGTFLRECPGNKFFEFEYFSFLFCFVEMLQSLVMEITLLLLLLGVLGLTFKLVLRWLY